MALLRLKQGRPAEAAQLLERLAATSERVYGPWHPELAKTLLNLGLARADLRQDEEARQLFERALAITERSLDAQTGGLSGSTKLELADFQAVATAVQTASLSNAANNGDWSAGSLNAAGLAAINKTGTTQFRVYFSLDDNDDMGADYIGYYSGEAASANRPQLVITYQ